MKIISHRGNLEGPDSSLENRIDQIEKCINLGFDVECDLRYVNNEYLLGHDEGLYSIGINDLIEFSDCLWIHCKNIELLERLSSINNSNQFNFFWHQTDFYTLTSKGFIWSYPGNKVTENCINVMPEMTMNKNHIRELRSSNLFGVCTDYPTFLV